MGRMWDLVAGAPAHTLPPARALGRLWADPEASAALGPASANSNR